MNKKNRVKQKVNEPLEIVWKAITKKNRDEKLLFCYSRF